MSTSWINFCIMCFNYQRYSTSALLLRRSTPVHHPVLWEWVNFEMGPKTAALWPPPGGFMKYHPTNLLCYGFWGWLTSLKGPKEETEANSVPNFFSMEPDKEETDVFISVCSSITSYCTQQMLFSDIPDCTFASYLRLFQYLSVPLPMYWGIPGGDCKITSFSRWGCERAR